MRVHAKIERSTVNGPGARAVVFLQGCSLACPGCQNPETHHPNRGEFMTSVELAHWILSREGITGVTFSGGEPLEQLEDGLDLTIGIVRDRRPDFSIGRSWAPETSGGLRQPSRTPRNTGKRNPGRG